MALKKPKTKSAFFNLERETWQKLNSTVKALPRDAWTEPGAAGDWTLKDVWAHIADWMRETRRVVPILQLGKKVALSIPDFNRKRYNHNRKMQLALARRQIEIERRKTISLLRALPEETLVNDRKIYIWASFGTFNHYVEHLPDLARFCRKQKKK